MFRILCFVFIRLVNHTTHHNCLVTFDSCIPVSVAASTLTSAIESELTTQSQLLYAHTAEMMAAKASASNKLFRQFDVNKNGTLDHTEFREYVGNLSGETNSKFETNA